MAYKSLGYQCVKDRKIEMPLIRTIEPPKKVYKKSIGGVIIVASIPKDAQVRGSLNTKCRSDKATIIDIIGEFCGEKIGISMRDPNVCYKIGDIVEIKDFDYSERECTSGFHFFCTKKLAEKYK